MADVADVAETLADLCDRDYILELPDSSFLAPPSTSSSTTASARRSRSGRARARPSATTRASQISWSTRTRSTLSEEYVAMLSQS